MGVAWGEEEGSYFLVLKDCTCRKRKCHTEIFMYVLVLILGRPCYWIDVINLFKFIN